MLTKQKIRERLIDHAPEIRRLGIHRIGLFGSYVRQAQQEDSDIDLLVDFEKDQETFDNFMELCNFLDVLFEGETIDVVTLNGLSPYIGPHILKEVEYVEIAN